MKHFGAVAAIFGGLLLLTLPVSLNVPMHADDYEYGMKGIGLAAHWQHYMQWSGRVVADYVSTFLLNLPSHNLANILNACALIASVCLVMSLASQLTKIAIPKIAYLYVYLLYWLANPALGETTFWIVGSSNYLWTNLFILIFLNYFCYSYTKSAPYKAVGCILGFLAGCSNENTAIALVLIVCALIAHFKIRHGHSAKNGIPYLAAALAGVLVLLLAPGNYNRLHVVRSRMYWDWFSKSFFDKILYHLTDRLIHGLKPMWPLWLAFLFMFTAAFATGPKTRDRHVFPVLFLAAGLLSMCAMAAAVVAVQRAYNGPLFFFLIAFGVLFLQTHASTKRITRHFRAFLIVLILFFARSYGYVYSTYRSVDIQKALQVATLDFHRGVPDATVELPSFFFPRLARESDRLVSYNLGPMGKYFGMDNELKFSKEVNFDYSGIVTGKSRALQDHAVFSRIFISGASWTRPGTLILEADNKLPEDVKSVNVLLSNGRKLCNLNMDEIRPVALSGKYYIGLQYDGLRETMIDGEISVAVNVRLDIPSELKIRSKKCDGTIDAVTTNDDGTVTVSGWLVHSVKDQLPAKFPFVIRENGIPLMGDYPIRPVRRPDLTKFSRLFVFSGYAAILDLGGSYTLGYGIDDKLYKCRNLKVTAERILQRPASLPAH